MITAALFMSTQQRNSSRLIAVKQSSQRVKITACVVLQSFPCRTVSSNFLVHVVAWQLCDCCWWRRLIISLCAKLSELTCYRASSHESDIDLRLCSGAIPVKSAGYSNLIWLVPTRKPPPMKPQNCRHLLFFFLLCWFNRYKQTKECE